MKANVSKMLRSALSMFLALAMVIGMVPAAFAAEVPTIDAENTQSWEGLHTELHELVDYLQADPVNGIQAAVDYIEANGEGIQAYAEKAHEIMVREYEALKAAISTEDKIAIKGALTEVKDKLVALKGDLEDEIVAQGEKLVDPAIAANEAMIAEINSAIANCEKTLENVVAGIAAIDAALEYVDAAMVSFGEALEGVREAILYLDNVVVEELNPAVENLNEVAKNATFETLKSAAAAVADAKDAVEVAIALAQEAFGIAAETAANAYELIDATAAELAGVIEGILPNLESAKADAVAHLEERYEAAVARVNTTFGHDIVALKALLDQLTPEMSAAAAIALLLEYYNVDVVECKEEMEKLLALTEAEYERFVAEDLPVIIAELEAVYAEMTVAVEAAKAEIEAQLPAVIAALEEAYAAASEIAANADEVVANLVATVEALVAQIEKQINALIEMWNLAYTKATTSPYLINTDSKYVGVGDATAVSASYVEDLYAELVKSGLPTGAYANVASSSVVYAKDIAAQIPAVADADLVTVGLGNITFLQNAVAAAIENAFDADIYTEESILDWSTVAGEWLDYEVIEPVFMEIYEGLWLYEGMDKQVAAIITAALEAYAYSVASYATQVPELINAIHSVNPYAVVVLVGMYNPLDGFTVEGVNVGQYIDILVEAASIHGKAYAMLTGNAIYVDAPDVETAGEFTVQAVLKNDYSALLPSAAGHKYIQTCIYEALGLYNPVVMRVYGAERYETALAAADTMLEVTGAGKFDTIVVATGRDFADALAGSYLAAVKDAPILLVKDSKADMVGAYIAENLAENGTVYVLGGENAVSAATAAKLGNVVRLSGADRYATNLAILAEAGVNGGEILVATGKNYADALSASSTGKPVLLVSSSLKEEQKAFLAASGVEKLTILGGEAAVSATVAAELEAYAPVARIGGADRYETSALIADYFFGGRNGSVVVASGRDYPDALCGGALAAAAGVPVVLTKHGGIDVADNYAVKAALGVVLGGDQTGITEQDIVDIFELLSADAITEVIYK